MADSIEGVKRAAIYIRVSTEKQASEGESLPAQQARLTEWAKANGYVIVEEYVDAGESARVASRPQFVRMLQDAKQKDKLFDAILVWRWDRFARNTDDAVIYKGLLRRQLGMELISIGDPATTGAVGVLLERILDVVAEFQSLITSEHVKNTMTFLAKGGRWLGKVPFGYELGPEGTLVPDSNAADAVVWAFRQVGNLQESIASVASVFSAGTQFRSTARYKWSSQAVRQMLRNPVYLGKAVWNRRYTVIGANAGGLSSKQRRARGEDEWVVVDGAHPALVEQPLFDSVQRVLDDVRQKYAKREHYGEYLFRGLVRCSQCGRQMIYYAPHNGSRPRLACGGYFRSPRTCSPFNYVHADDLAQIVTRQMTDLVAGEVAPDLEFKIDRPHRRSPAMALDAAKLRLRRLIDGFEAGGVTLDELRERRALIDSEIAALEAKQAPDSGLDRREEQITRLRERLASTLPTILEADVAVERQNAMLAEVVERIVIDRQAQRVRIVWRVPDPMFNH